MEKKRKEAGIIIRQEKIAGGIYSMWIRTRAAAQAAPGQFIGLFTRNGSRLLPRPISICEIGGGKDSLRIVYRIAGQGTREFSECREGDPVEFIGPLGNGYPLGNVEKKAFLIGGGIGIPPILQLSKELAGEKQIILGYRDELYLHEDFASYGQVYIATEDGSAGTKGTVLTAIKEEGLTADVIYACGPMPMLKALAAFAKEQGIPAYISLEERMACGVGACLGCVCKTKTRDAHSNVYNRRVCTDGPVFLAEEVDFT